VLARLFEDPRGITCSSCILDGGLAGVMMMAK